MPLNLPAPDQRQLARSPLALVVCQVRFEDVLWVSDSRVRSAVHDALGGRQGPYPKAEKLITQGANFDIGPSGAVATAPLASVSGWRFSSRDGRWTVTLMPGHVALETTAYTNWADDFRPRLKSLITATAEHVRPDLEQRLGLRYVNRITEPKVASPQEWHSYIAPELLGVILHERLGPAATAVQQQVDLDVRDGVQCGFRYGFYADSARDNALTYVLDFDVYREEGLIFDTDDILTTTDEFNDWVLRLFQQSITPNMHSLLLGEEEQR